MLVVSLVLYGISCISQAYCKDHARKLRESHACKQQQKYNEEKRKRQRKRINDKLGLQSPARALTKSSHELERRTSEEYHLQYLEEGYEAGESEEESDSEKTFAESA